MPRQSAASLELVPIGERERPPAPDQLSVDEADIWDKIVRAMPADWFGPENYTLLVQYCRHIIRSEQLAALLRKMELDGTALQDPRIYTKLIGQEILQSTAICMLATKMRLSQQSTFVKTAKKVKSSPKLWES